MSPAFLPVEESAPEYPAAPAAQISPETPDRSPGRPASAASFVSGLHDIYAREKDRLATAYEGRELARKEREAYLRAHPPKPEDITVRFWRTKREEAPAADQKGGDQ